MKSSFALNHFHGRPSKAHSSTSTDRFIHAGSASHSITEENSRSRADQVFDFKEDVRKCGNCNGVSPAEHERCGIPAGRGITKGKDDSALYVFNPHFRDSGFYVKWKLAVEIMQKAGVRNFDYQKRVFPTDPFGRVIVKSSASLLHRLLSKRGAFANLFRFSPR